jgi:hypothetical protein
MERKNGRNISSGWVVGRPSVRMCDRMRMTTARGKELCIAGAALMACGGFDLILATFLCRPNKMETAWFWVGVAEVLVGLVVSLAGFRR